MSLGRREFLISASALAVSARSALAGQAVAARPAGALPPTIRADFPAASLETYLNAAAIHPLGTFAAEAVGCAAPARAAATSAPRSSRT
jgi:hypothetical protein